MSIIVSIYRIGTSLPKAKNKYIRINTEAMRVLKSGGLLYTFSCSAAVTQTNALKDFVKEVCFTDALCIYNMYKFNLML